MKYMLLIHQGTTPFPPSAEWDALPDQDKASIYSDYQAVSQTPGVTPGRRMQPPEDATTVRVRSGEVLSTDGPFAETKEAVGGYLFFDAPDLDAAIALAAMIPAARMGGAVEIRPLVAP
ncbi:MAG: YciI family protein [Solirubrobacteraceae bacterium]